jgi:hypothetical protein
MKSILYVGAALMAGASIYGFIDYRKTSRNGDLDRMYKAEEISQPLVTEEKTTPVVEVTPVIATKEPGFVIIPEGVVPAKKKVKKSKKVLVEAVEKLEAKPAVVNTYRLKENVSIAPYKKVKRKKLDRELFSRARPRVIEEVEIKLPEPVKEQ